MTKALDGLGLPDKDREQMLQAPPDEFLPSYEFAIKKYFERIIEDEGRSSAEQGAGSRERAGRERGAGSRERAGSGRRTNAIVERMR